MSISEGLIFSEKLKAGSQWTFAFVFYRSIPIRMKKISSNFMLIGRGNEGDSKNFKGGTIQYELRGSYPA